MGVKLIVCEDSVMKVLVRPSQVTIEKSPYHPASSVHPIAPAFSQSYPSVRENANQRRKTEPRMHCLNGGAAGPPPPPVLTIALAAGTIAPDAARMPLGMVPKRDANADAGSASGKSHEVLA